MSFSICHDPSSYTMPGSHRLTPSQDIGGWSNHLRSTWARQILWHHLPGGLHRTLGDEAWKHLVKTMELPESNWIQLNPTESNWILSNFGASSIFWGHYFLMSESPWKSNWSTMPPAQVESSSPASSATKDFNLPWLASNAGNGFAK